MTALPCQPVPTAHQRRELDRLLASDRAKRHAVRQYADNQPKQALLSPVEAAGVACCATEVDVPRPTPGEDGEPQVMAWVGSTPVLIIVALACIAWVAYFWSVA